MIRSSTLLGHVDCIGLCMLTFAVSRFGYEAARSLRPAILEVATLINKNNGKSSNRPNLPRQGESKAIPIPVRCPECNRVAHIQPDRLHGALRCPDCQAAFRETNETVGERRSLKTQFLSSDLVMQVPWLKHLTFLLSPWKLAALLLLVGFLFALPAIDRNWIRPISKGLVERSTYVAKAWCENDASKFLRLMGSGSSSEIREWLQNERSTYGAGPLKQEVEVTVISEDNDLGTASTRVKIFSADGKKAATKVYMIFWIKDSWNEWRIDGARSFLRKGRR